MAQAVANPADFQLAGDHSLRRSGRRGFLLGLVAVGLLVYGAMETPTQFFRSYLVAYLYWTGIALGSLVLLMIQHITGGMWGVSVRRHLEAATRTLPLMAILFIPVALGIHELYEWSHLDVVAKDKILQHKSVYLNQEFFLARAVVYFVIWSGVMFFLNRWSTQQDRVGHSPALGRRFLLMSRWGIVLYAITITCAAVDWAMSLEPHWFSTIYGVLIAGGQVLCGMAFTIVAASRMADRAPISDVLTPDRFHDLGKFLLAFTMLWAYFTLSQGLIIWSGNLPEEIPWYLNRLAGGWEYIALGIIAFHFVLPFVCLLSRSLKRNRRALGRLALVVLLARFVELYWLITPAFSPKAFAPHWLDLAALVGVGGIWLAIYVQQLQRRPLMPLHDPELS